jgi:putative membrane protein
MDTSAEKLKDISEQRGKLSDHLANERTFLAWVRTSIGIMAFGFVVVKFTLFVKQISLMLQKPLPAPAHGYTSIMGIFLVGFGALTGVLAFFRYRTIEKQLVNSNYHPSTKLSSVLTVCILIIGVFLVLYLLRSI